jgi:hypothetical protein
MKRNLLLIICLWLISACDFKPAGGRNNATPDKILQLKLRPMAGANYDYKVSNETKTEFDADNKTIESTNKTDYVVNYSINKDSSGNFLVGIRYKKIHIYQKKNDEESDLDADNTGESSDPVERMLGALKEARITATINPSGEVIKVSGYQQIPDQFLSQLNNIDPNAKMEAQKQWQQLIENNLVKKNIDRLFKMFPDSAVHIGDKWKMAYKEAGDINFAVKDFFTLKSVEDGKAIVESSGRISTDSSASTMMGYQVNSNLKGTQEGEYEIAIKTGMIENCEVKTALDGSLNVMGREIPVSINIKIKIRGSEN